MRKLLSIIAVAFVASYTSALAADIAVKAPPPAAAAPAWSWSGFYLGGDLGGLWERDPGSTTFTGVAPSPSVVQSNTLSANSLIGGVHVGFNWQWNQLVVGEEADWDWNNAHGTFCRGTDGAATNSPACADTIGNGFLTFTSKTDGLGSLRGRLGFAWDRVLVYGTGGFALGRVDSTLQANCPAACGVLGAVPAFSTAKFSSTRSGWVAGAGIETMFTANWSVRVEYLHYDLGSTSFTAATPAGGPVVTTESWSRSFRYDTVRGGLSYKFGS